MTAKQRKLGGVLALTGGFLVIEVAGALLSGSLALLADAGHMATDVLALSLAYVGARVAARPSHPAERFGNRRWEVMAAMLNGLALFAVAGGIAVEAAHRLRVPAPIDLRLFGGVALAGLTVNVIALRVLHGDHQHDLNVRGAYLHILGDLLGSIGALVAAGVIHLTGWTGADPVVSVLICCILFVSAGRLVMESGEILLDRVPRAVAIPELEAAMRAVEGVTQVHDLHVWRATARVVAASAHAVVPDLGRHPAVRAALEGALRARGVGHVTLQLETEAGCAGCDPEGDHDHGDHAHDHAHPHPRHGAWHPHPHG